MDAKADESWLGAQVILFVLSCRAAAQFSFQLIRKSFIKSNLDQSLISLYIVPKGSQMYF